MVPPVGDGDDVSIVDQPRSVTGRPQFSGPLAATLSDPDAGRVLGVPSDAFPNGGPIPAQGTPGPTAHASLLAAGRSGSIGGCAAPEGWPVYESRSAAAKAVDGLGDGADRRR
jgi:hypothetical protein